MTAVAKVNPTQTLRGLLEQSRSQIATALPKHLTAERMIRVALTAFQRTPALQDCSPISVVGCVVQASELGLELAGPLGQAYMVPYYNKNTKQKEAQFQVGYRGLMDLAYRSGKVQTFNAHCVYANDKFKFSYGTKPLVTHEPTLNDPGDVVAVYAVLNLTGGGFDFEVMSTIQIENHRKKYSKQKDGGDYNPWNTAWEEMAKKTVIRKLAKRAPVSIEVRRAAALDEYGEAAMLPAFDLPELSLPAQPVGRQSLRTPPATNGNGNGKHVDPEPDLDSQVGAEPSGMEHNPGSDDEPPQLQDGELTDQQIEMERNDTVIDLKTRLGQCETTSDMQAVGKDMMKFKDFLGDKSYELVLAAYQERAKIIEGKAKGKKAGAA